MSCHELMDQKGAAESNEQRDQCAGQQSERHIGIPYRHAVDDDADSAGDGRLHDGGGKRGAVRKIGNKKGADEHCRKHGERAPYQRPADLCHDDRNDDDKAAEGAPRKYYRCGILHLFA